LLPTFVVVAHSLAVLGSAGGRAQQQHFLEACLRGIFTQHSFLTINGCTQQGDGRRAKCMKPQPQQTL
jgi:hypothetical protein